MNIQDQINQYIASQPEPKRADMEVLHGLILQVLPAGKLWFDDGKNNENKTISNPTIGYGNQTLNYANGKTREFFQFGLSANATGFSVYILGIKDKAYLTRTFGHKLGKAKVTGYCIRFRAIRDIHLNILETALREGLETSLRE